MEENDSAYLTFLSFSESYDTFKGYLHFQPFLQG